MCTNYSSARINPTFGANRKVNFYVDEGWLNRPEGFRAWWNFSHTAIPGKIVLDFSNAGSVFGPNDIVSIELDISIHSQFIGRFAAKIKLEKLCWLKLWNEFFWFAVVRKKRIHSLFSLVGSLLQDFYSNLGLNGCELKPHFTFSFLLPRDSNWRPLDCVSNCWQVTPPRQIW